MTFSLLTPLRLGSLALLLAGCTKSDVPPTTECVHLATIIGYAPCGTQGYLLALDSPRDTVNCYNLPEGILPATPNLTHSERNDGLFAAATFVRVKIGYTTLLSAERTATACLGNVYLGRWARMTKGGEEIKLLCAEKQ